MYKPFHLPCLQTLDELKVKCKEMNLRLILPDNLKEQKKLNIKRNKDYSKLDQQKVKRLRTNSENGKRDGQLNGKNNDIFNDHLNSILINGKLNVKFNGAILIESGKVNGIIPNNKMNDLVHAKLSDGLLVEKDVSNNVKQMINVKIVNELLDTDQKAAENTIVENRSSKFYRKDEPIDDLLKNLDNLKQLEATFDFYMQLNNYAKQMNELLVKFNNKPVVVENKVDQDLPPKFTYINEYNFDALDDSTIKLIESTVQKCNCVHDCESYISKNSASCCSSNGDGCFYNSTGLIKHTILRRGPIFECSKSCSCSQKCPNRVIQKGTQVNLAIFKTNDGRGWGLKAMEKIPKNKFICSYRGQVITSDEALKRQSTSPFTDRYFFDLDYSIDLQFEYVVDATNYSNLGRFLNHSCLPNCETFIAYIETAFMKIPVISFFTNTAILPGQELTIDYFHENDPAELRETKVKCLCKAPNCRDYAF